MENHTIKIKMEKIFKEKRLQKLMIRSKQVEEE